MKIERKEQGVGALALVALLGLLVVLNQSRDRDLSPSGDFRVNALFNSVDGLAVGDDVRMGGIQVGMVERFVLDEKYRAVVTFLLEEGLELPIDSSASIQTDGLFGSLYVVLEPGAEEELAKSGDTLTLTENAIIVSDLLELIIAQGRAKLEERKKAAAEAEKTKN